MSAHWRHYHPGGTGCPCPHDGDCPGGAERDLHGRPFERIDEATHDARREHYAKIGRIVVTESDGRRTEIVECCPESGDRDAYVCWNGGRADAHTRQRQKREARRAAVLAGLREPAQIRHAHAGGEHYDEWSHGLLGYDVVAEFAADLPADLDDLDAVAAAVAEAQKEALAAFRAFYADKARRPVDPTDLSLGKVAGYGVHIPAAWRQVMSAVAIRAKRRRDRRRARMAALSRKGRDRTREEDEELVFLRTTARIAIS